MAGGEAIRVKRAHAGRSVDDLLRDSPRASTAASRAAAGAYLQGPLAQTRAHERLHMAEAAGDAHRRNADFISRVHWMPHAWRYLRPMRLSISVTMTQARWLVFDRPRIKKGDKSEACRAIFRHAGSSETCQIGVFSPASRHGHALIDRALDLPETWAADAARRAEAGVPEEISFTPKPKLGQAMLKRAFAAGVPCAFVVSDSLYGADHQTRRLIEASGRGYVLAVTSAQRLGRKPVENWLEDGPAKGWTRLSAGDGAKGPRLYDWAYLPYGIPPAGWKSGLLIRRKKGGASFHVYSPGSAETPL